MMSCRCYQRRSSFPNLQTLNQQMQHYSHDQDDSRSSGPNEDEELPYFSACSNVAFYIILLFGAFC